MEVLEAIYTRQSVGKVSAEPVAREVIEQLLGAAVQAPNHYKVRPWWFVVLSGAARERLGAVMAASLKQNNPEIPESALVNEAAKPLRAPVIIAVGIHLVEDPRAIEIENICAAAAAVQNILLTATSLGLASMWRTGPAAYDPLVLAFLGFVPGEHLIGFIYLGYPDVPRPPVQRPGFEDRTVWME